MTTKLTYESVNVATDGVRNNAIRSLYSVLLYVLVVDVVAEPLSDACGLIATPPT